MKKKLFFAGMAALLLTFGLVLLACDNGDSSNNTSSNNTSGDNTGGNNTGGNNTSGGVTSVPGAPTGVKATAQSSSSIRITWNTVSGATSYKIYIGKASYSTFSELIGTSTTTSYTDTDCKPGETWYYKVSAVNSAGESTLSSYTNATTPSSGGNNTGGGGASVPSAPNVPTVTPLSATSLQISWSSVSGAVYYKLYRSAPGESDFSLLKDNLSVTSWVDLNLTTGGTYYYRVSAVNTNGESGYKGAMAGIPK